MEFIIFNKTLDIKSMLLVGEDARIEDLRIFGFDTEVFPLGLDPKKVSSTQMAYAVPATRGIQSAFSNLEIVNCEILGWTHARGYLSEGAKNVKINDCYIRGNQRYALGYGIYMCK